MPPPNFWIMAEVVAACMMEAMVSLMGMTKQAERVPWPVPALNRVGELGRKQPSAINS